MDDLFAGSAIVDLALALTALEAIVLVVLHRRTGRGVAPRALLANIGAGVFLMLGARAALVGAAWPWLALCLLAAGAAHGVDLALRWHVGEPPRGQGVDSWPETR